MIRVNLVPQDEARRQAARRRDQQAGILVAVLLVGLIGVAEFFTRGDASEVQREADLYQAQLADLTKKYQETVLLERRQSELEAKLKTIDVLERQRRGPVHVLADLGDATPEKLWLTEMREAGGAATLSGRGLDNQTVALFMRNLEDSPYFSNVELVETKQVEDGQAKLKEFAIRSSVIYGGRHPKAEAPAADEKKAEAEEKTAATDAEGASS
ncbi:MAG: PilN domain-containing protein [Candidatus Binatia bacterium]|nr:PilN domain-containing protein [Candidatus Binatia bacterium]